MPVIAVVGLKGGSGKSLTTITLAGELARRGRGVDLIDGDPFRAATRWALETQCDVHVEALAGALLRPDLLLEHIEQSGHVGIVDTPSMDREKQWNAMMASDVVLIPVIPGVLSTDTLTPTLALAQEAQRLRPWLRVGVFWTRGPRGTTRLAGASLVPRDWLMNVALSDRPQHERAMIEGVPVVSIAPRSVAAKEARLFADAVEMMLPKRIDPSMPRTGLPTKTPQTVLLGDDGEVPDGWAEPTVFMAEEDVLDRAPTDL
ncbi:MAG: ParA family protein [Deltaproteobacteria bacterium]|jgi:chromosome partitioning protein